MKTQYSYSPLKRFKDWLTGPFHSASTRLVRHLRSRGVKVGEGVVFRDAKSVTIDLTRPSLIEIGDNVDINVNFTIMTHDFASGVFLNKYNELINSSGRVKLGNNIYIGRDVTILKGVSIGDNCVIGLGSIVTSDITGVDSYFINTRRNTFKRQFIIKMNVCNQRNMNLFLDFSKSLCCFHGWNCTANNLTACRFQC